MADNITYYPTDIPQEGILFNREAFDAMTRANGSTLIHWKSLRCPLGLIDPFDDRRPHAQHDNCSNGHIYIQAGIVTAAFTNNSARNALKDQGNADFSTVSVTFPITYDDSNEELTVAPYDRFYYKDPVGYIESDDVVEASRTGLDRLQFPALSVTYLMDANGIAYSQGSDFIIESGNIRWISQRRPQYDPKINKGTVYSVRYKLQPFFYVKSMVHEIRVAKKMDINGNLSMQRMPFAVILQRELAFENKHDKTDPRNYPVPESGGFGVR